MTARHRVYLDQDTVEAIAFENGATIEVERTAEGHVMVCVVGGIEYAARLADVAAVEAGAA